MGIDTSIYGNVQQPQINIPSPLDTAQKAMALSSLGMQQMQMARQMQSQSAMQGALAHNTDPTTGQLDQQGYLSDLGKMSPMAAQQETSRLASQNKATAEAQAADLDAKQKALDFSGPAFEVLGKKDEDTRAAMYPQMIQQLKSNGVDVSNMDHPYDPTLFNNYLANWNASKAGIANHVAQANLAKFQAETPFLGPTAQAKLASEQYGSRSPNAEISSQYQAQAKPVQQSQMAMQQMIDNSQNRTPQGDASLMLNAYKIKFPDKPDVNSLDELSKSQSVPDQWKQAISHRVNGLFDQNTVDNLMRDGISTYRANVTGLRGIQQKFNDKAQQQGVPSSSSITNEPAIDQTYADAMNIQKNLGKYTPPTERGGLVGTVSGAVSKLLGGAASNTANAATPDPRDAQALEALKSMDASSPKAFKLRAILKSKGLL